MKNVRTVLALVVLSFAIILGLSVKKAEADEGVLCNCNFGGLGVWVDNPERGSCDCVQVPCAPLPPILE
jgi:hypothetical protein